MIRYLSNKMEILHPSGEDLDSIISILLQQSEQEITAIFGPNINNVDNAKDYMKERLLTTENRIPYIIKVDQDIIGMGQVTMVQRNGKREAWLCYGFVVPEKRNKGIASSMFGVLIEKTKELKPDTIELLVYETNRAKNLYLRNGFKVNEVLDDGRIHMIYSG